MYRFQNVLGDSGLLLLGFFLIFFFVINVMCMSTSLHNVLSDSSLFLIISAVYMSASPHDVPGYDDLYLNHNCIVHVTTTV